MDSLLGRHSFTGDTSRLNQLGHVSLVDGKDNTNVGLNAFLGGGSNNTVVGAHAGTVLDARSAGVVVVGARGGERMRFSTHTVAIGAEAAQDAGAVHRSVLIGAESGKKMRNAQYCTVVGYGAAANMVGGIRSTMVGAQSGVFALDSTDNTFVGESSGAFCRSGTMNVCVGSSSGQGMESGDMNVFTGYRAGANVGSSRQVVAVGALALQHAINSANVVAIGYGAGQFAAGAQNAVFIGAGSGLSSGAGAGNTAANSVFVGSFCGSGGSDNIGIGSGVMPLVSGNNNVALGTAAGWAVMEGSENVLIGPAAGANIVTESQNVAVGVRAGNAGNRNTSVGHQAGKLVEGGDNTSVGYDSGPVGAGLYNTCVGAQAGAALVGSDNVVIGESAAKSVAGSTNVIIGKAAAQNLQGGVENVIIGAATGQLMANGSQNVIIGASSARQLQGNRNLVMGTSILNSGAVSLNSSILTAVASGAAGLTATDTILMSTNSFNAPVVLTSSIVIGHSLTAPAGTSVDKSVLIGTNFQVTGADSNKCIIGIGGIRALEATTTSLSLGSDADKYLVANTQAFVLGPTSRPFVNIKRYLTTLQGETTARSLSRTFFPGSAYAMHRITAWADRRLEPVADEIGPSITNTSVLRPYPSDANAQMPYSERFTELYVYNDTPVYLASMQMQYTGYWFSDWTSSRADPLGAILGLRGSVTSFGWEAWVLPTGDITQMSGPLMGSMTVYATDTVDWAAGLATSASDAGIYTNAVHLAFEYSRADNTRVLLLSAVLMDEDRWHHVAINGSAGRVFMLINGTRVDIVEKVGHAGLWHQTSPGPAAPVVSYHTVTSRRWQALGLRLGRRDEQHLAEYGSGPLQSATSVCMAETLFCMPITTSPHFVNSTDRTLYFVPYAARPNPAVSTPLTDGVQVYVNTVEETPALSVNYDMNKLYAVQVNSINVLPNQPGLRSANSDRNIFPLPWSHPLTRIRMYNGSHIQMSRMPVYLDMSGEYGLAINTVYTDGPLGYGYNNPFGANSRVTGTFLFGKTGTLGCAITGNTSMLGATGVFGWDAAGVVAHANLIVRGGAANDVVTANAGGVFLRSGATFNGSGAGLTNIPASSIVGNVNNVQLASGDAALGNVSIAGVLTSTKTGVVSGFEGGPRVSQGRWDSPGGTHTLQWPALADGCDNVSGVLYLHVSSKSAAKKNGVATVSLVKDAGTPPDLMVMALHKSDALATFSVGRSGDDITVATDADCALCYTFVGAV